MDLPRPHEPHHDERPSNGKPPVPTHHNADPTHPGDLILTDDLIGLVPHLLGFHPQDGTLVFLFFDRDTLMLSGHLRLLRDIRTTSADTIRRIWRGFEPALRGRQVDAVTVIGYLDQEGIDGLHRIAAAAPFPITVIRLHAGRRWRLHCPRPGSCTDPGCTPWGAKIQDRSPHVAELIATHTPPATSLDDLAARLLPGPAETVTAVAALLPLNPLPPPKALHRSVQAEYAARAVRAQHRQGGQRDPQLWSPDHAARLIQAAAVPTVRDHCAPWIEDAALTLWLDLIRYAPPGWVAPVACLIATTAYQRADGVMAQIAVEHALGDRPGYEPAQLLQTLLAQRVPPEALTTFLATALALHPIDPDPPNQGEDR